jgi:hypothetical protein
VKSFTPRAAGSPTSPRDTAQTWCEPPANDVVTRMLVSSTSSVEAPRGIDATRITTETCTDRLCTAA